MRSGTRTSAGPRITNLTAKSSSFAATQAAWRFFNNENVSLPTLVSPLLTAGRDAVAGSAGKFALVVHDWSKICSVNDDAKQLTHAADQGYELFSALLVNADNGAPLAPLALRLESDTAVHCTYRTNSVGHLDQVTEVMRETARSHLPRQLVHIIDREADSVDHYRQWHSSGYRWLVRADDKRRVLWRGQEQLLPEIVAQLTFNSAGQADYQGRSADLMVTETNVTLHRPAKRKQHGKQVIIPGPPLNLRLVVARVVLDDKVAAQWLLLTNVTDETAATIAQWYYWRWQIESFFKLLKSAGHELERWQQTSAAAISRRLLVAAMACVVVWQLQTQSTQAATEMKRLLMKLSGRAVKRTRPVTAPGLLAGLFVLLSILELFETHGRDPTYLKDLALTAIPFLRSYV